MKRIYTFSLLIAVVLSASLGTAWSTKADASVIPQTNWKLRYVDSQELIGENGAAINAFDGNPATIWHTEWKLKKASLPHQIQIDLGAIYNIDGFRYLPRQDGGVNGTIAQYSLYVSADGINWGTPVKQGTFGSDLTQKEVLFPAVSGRFVRLVATREINSKIFTSAAELNLLGTLATAPAKDAVPQSGMSVLYVDSEELVGEDGAATNAFDGNPATIWHTEWKNAIDPLPHQLYLDLGSAYEISELVYLPRQVGTNGTITKCEIYVSRDGIDWGSAVAAVTLAADSTEKRIALTPKIGQFIALVVRKTINNKPFASAAEINVRGSCDIPYIKILQPADYALAPTSDLLVTPSVCMNHIQRTGGGIKYTLDGGRQYIARIAPYSIMYKNVPLTEHTVEAKVVDINGVAISGPMTADQVTHVGVGDYYVAIGDSITAGLYDNISSDDVSWDGRDTGGGYPPVLNNLLTASKGYPHTVVMEGFPGYTSAQGLAELPSILSRNPGSEYCLLMFGTNDSGGLLPVTPAKYKDNMQQMINLIRSSGKQAYLAKVPYTLNAGLNSVIRNYNVVIDQLVIDNNIPVMPPDFYGYFATHQNEFGDSLHPNGRGYQSMANLWHAVLP